MIDLVRKFFSSSTDSSSNDQEEGNSHDIRIATCALLLEMANIDGEFDESERDNIISVLKKDYDLFDEDLDALIDATENELKGSIDLWQFTNLINQNYSIEKKLQVIETVWRVAYADGKLEKHEDYLVHKLANLLRLSNKQLIEAKLKVLHG
ncbi:MAG: TerB family tellurite resistance protein [Deltaproteobacteria bacterium]|nr:TerB family tellurite resistance protein [Deltaproteobacteria bacterium]